MAYKYAKVLFSQTSGSVYEYAIPDYLVGKLEEDDLVVVEACLHGHPRISVGIIDSLSEISSYGGEVKYIMDHVDNDRYENYLAEQKTREHLYAQMEARLREVDMVAMFSKVAEHDAQMKDLYDQYTSL